MEALEGRITRIQGNFWGDKYVHYLDWSDGFPGIHKSILTKLQILNMCSLLHVNYTSIKLFLIVDVSVIYCQNNAV